MANIVPSDISRLALSGGHPHELETLQRLKTALPDDYTVFHGVHWSREYGAWSHFGEFDLWCSTVRVMCCSSSRTRALEESAAGLIKRYGQDEKNVVHQLHRSIDKVREKFTWQTAGAATGVDYLFTVPTIASRA